MLLITLLHVFLIASVSTRLIKFNKDSGSANYIRGVSLQIIYIISTGGVQIIYIINTGEYKFRGVLIICYTGSVVGQL